MTWVKLCGMTRREDVEGAVAAGADAVGFVTSPRSVRRVTAGEAAVLGEGISIARYLVTVDLEPGLLLAAARLSRVDGVQPHGRYAAAAADLLMAEGYRVLYPVPVDGPPGLDAVPDGAVPLLDTAVAGRHGGTGRSFDWRWAAGLGRPVVVAGGLTPDNVAEAVAASGAWGVDAASGIESAPGRKDADAMRRFVEAVR
ncbi:MAG: phosphoribosylanthranilate isomerase [Actinobacteria bacterium]|jgi:phosphoribosylanthranilate isomerase|nr:phosphoribosylanthranilate isomerase [Actinomycetota bacterium]MBU1494430.1 phosphoribosylanthranilate isomerase [Actinomycetota bacterium]MBU1865408.1 phosphoribosylanthranilate isomerase [Actinomycetota bacterium]